MSVVHKTINREWKNLKDKEVYTEIKKSKEGQIVKKL